MVIGSDIFIREDGEFVDLELNDDLNGNQISSFFSDGQGAEVEQEDNLENDEEDDGYLSDCKKEAANATAR